MLMDKVIGTLDSGLRTLFVEARASRARPDAHMETTQLNDAQRRKSAALMRINHVGEVCAQALYSGQAFTSRSPHIVDALKHAATEETDHLAWCESRIKELGGRKSLLNPLWYSGSFALGAIAGVIGDKWNLGFLAETEQQVGAHLAGHLEKLSNKDIKTRKIIEQMQADELSHAKEAQQLGAADLPEPVKIGMKFGSRIMTTTAYYV
ncbi:MAG: 2-polyprenyl-3-methyl-6-methoxy-1,4-benzoquinone monooxygenase [Methylophilaceae bacterium]